MNSKNVDLSPNLTPALSTPRLIMSLSHEILFAKQKQPSSSKPMQAAPGPEETLSSRAHPAASEKNSL